MSNAFWQMNNTRRNRYFNSHAYTVCKKEFIQKLSEFNKGKTPWNKGISPSEETRKKLSEANRRRTPPTKNKRWINNGDKQIYIEVNSELPEGYTFGRLKRNKIK